MPGTAGSPFALVPFAKPGPDGGFAIGGEARRDGARLSVRWSLSGDLSLLSLAGPPGPPSRRDGLWRDTCFEMFLAVAGEPDYWEFNLAPSGDWNVYHFAGYRDGMLPELALRKLPFTVSRAPRRLDLAVSVDLDRLGAGARELEAGVSVVLRTRLGGLGHWALRHAGPEPDFHRRDGFLLRLPATSQG